ncbi:MAG: hypothetical protein JNJ56_06645 [Ignavibacteria bacterium]|nr:hypothetical protein [Ignavibacteria bacterium]
MKNILLILCLFMILKSDLLNAQPANSPYPVIFVHGLNSDDQTWNTTLTQLSASWILSSDYVLSAVLNARGGDTTNYNDDVIIPQKDLSGNYVNYITASSIYAVNFGNFWNRNPPDPRIILYSNSLPGSNQSPGNQSSIYKQGYALKIFIDSVLRVTGASKVILAGHSMGGLAIREYLQRTENGIHKWWIDPYDPVNGHKVARVVTIGTPHLGTNVSSIPFTTIDFNSEAIRDMRYSFSSANAPYLFGNSETVVPSSYYNKDINCNGFITDTITGISNSNSDNPLAPLPLNITYTWITSNYLGLGTDLAVPLNRQWLYSGSASSPAGVSDTILTNKNHIQETSDAKSLIRGLDEPDKRLFAYEVLFNNTYAGFITTQTNGITSDTDFYKVNFNSGGKLSMYVKSVSAGVTNFAVLSENGNTLASKNISGSSDSISCYCTSGNYYLRLLGNSSQNTNFNSYNFSVTEIPSVSLNLTTAIEGMWNGVIYTGDTLKVYLRNEFSPYSVSDSATAYSDSDGNSSMSIIHTLTGNYYIQIVHRNSVQTWSSVPVSFINGNTSTFDFQATQTNAYGNNQVLKSGKWCIYSGDINQDGTVDASDLSGVENDAASGMNGYIPSDVTGDNFVDAEDLSIVENNAATGIEAIVP